MKVMTASRQARSALVASPDAALRLVIKYPSFSSHVTGLTRLLLQQLFACPSSGSGCSAAWYFPFKGPSFFAFARRAKAKNDGHKEEKYRCERRRVGHRVSPVTSLPMRTVTRLL